MKIDRICFEQLYPTGVYANQRFRVEATISDDDDISESYKKLAAEVDNAFSSMHPEIKWEEIKPTQPDPIDNRISIIIQDIQNCEVVDEVNSLGVQVGLLGFSKMTSAHPELQAAYDKRFKELTK